MPGGQGYSWFEVVLDTTAPVLTWDELPTEVDQGGQVHAVVSVDEGFIADAYVLADGNEYPLNVNQIDTFSFEITGTSPNVDAHAQLAVVATDEVANADIYTADFIIGIVPGSRGQSWVAIELDTHAPVLTWIEAPTSVDQGQPFEFSFTLNEPWVEDAFLDLNGTHYTLSIQQTEPLHYLVWGDAPADSGNGNVVVVVRDEVDNSALRTAPLAVGDVVEPPPPPTPFVPGPFEPIVVRRHEDRFPAFFRVVVHNEDRIPAVFYVRERFTVAARFSIIQEREDRFMGLAVVSDRIARIKREDEEILAVLLGGEQ